MELKLLFLLVFFYPLFCFADDENSHVTFTNTWTCVFNISLNINCHNFTELNSESNLYIPSDVISSDPDNNQHLSSIAACQLCLGLVTEMEKHKTEGKLVIIQLANGFCNRLLILGWPCRMLASLIIEKAFKELLDNVTPQSICSNVLHICSLELNGLLSIMDTMDRNVVLYDQAKFLYSSRFQIIPATEIAGGQGLLAVDFTEHDIATTFAHASTTYNFLAKYSLIPNSMKCPSCDSDMTFITEASTDSAYWRCNTCRREVQKTIKKSPRDGSYIALTKLKLIDFFKIHYFWSESPNSVFKDYETRFGNSKGGLKVLLENICDRLSDWVDDNKENERIGGDGVQVEFFITKQFLESSKYKYIEGKRSFEFVISSISWTVPPKFKICPETFVNENIPKLDFIECMTRHLVNESIIVAPENFFDTLGGIKEFKKDLQAAANVQDYLLTPKTIESLKATASITKFKEMRSTMEHQISQKKGMCETFTSLYFFYRTFSTKHFGNYFKIISETYGF